MTRARSAQRSVEVEFKVRRRVATKEVIVGMRDARALWTPTLVAISTVACLLLGRSYADGPAPDIDDSPLQSPVPYCYSMKTPQEVLLSINKELEEGGYTVSYSPFRKGELLAAKQQEGGAQDKFLMWLARDIDNSSKVNVFVEYGRFEAILGKGLKRVVVDEAVKQEQIATVMKIANKRRSSCKAW